MTEIRVAVADDEKIALSTVSGAIRSAFAEFEITADIREFSSLNSLYFEMEKESFDLLILDVDMNDKINGIDFAKKLRNANVSADILFVSNCEDKAFDAFEVRPLGFIRKKNFIEDLERHIPKIAESLKRKKKPTTILLNNDKGEQVQVPVHEITYVEGSLKEQYFYTEDNKIYSLKKTMRYIEGELLNAGFIRTHASYLVNAVYVRGMGKDFVIVAPDIHIPVSRARMNDVKKEYLALIKKNDVLR